MQRVNLLVCIGILAYVTGLVCLFWIAVPIEETPGVWYGWYNTHHTESTILWDTVGILWDCYYFVGRGMFRVLLCVPRVCAYARVRRGCYLGYLQP